MEALAGERDALWSRLQGVTFLTDDEKRAAAGYEPLLMAPSDSPAGSRPEGAETEVADTGAGPFDATTKYRPDQPRVAAGNPDGGQWTDEGGGISAGSGDRVRVAQAGGDGSGYLIDLLEEEAFGGHTYWKHVGKSTETLKGYVRETILNDPDPDKHDIRSGSFPSLEAANKLVNATLMRNKTIVEAIAKGLMPEQRVEAEFGSFTGIEAYAATVRSQPRIRLTTGVGAYVRRTPNSRNGFRVISAYPRNID